MMICSEDIPAIKAEIEKHRKQASAAFDRYSGYSASSEKTYSKHKAIVNALETALEAEIMQRRLEEAMKRLYYFRSYMNDDMYHQLYEAFTGRKR